MKTASLKKSVNNLFRLFKLLIESPQVFGLDFKIKKIEFGLWLEELFKAKKNIPQIEVPGIDVAKKLLKQDYFSFLLLIETILEDLKAKSKEPVLSVVLEMLRLISEMKSKVKPELISLLKEL